MLELHLLLLSTQPVHCLRVIMQVRKAACEGGAGSVMTSQKHQQQVADDLSICQPGETTKNGNSSSKVLLGVKLKDKQLTVPALSTIR